MKNHFNSNSITESRFKCSKCGGGITGEYFIGDGKMFHPNCLDRTPVWTKTTISNNSHLFFYFLISLWPQCGRCGQAITTAEVSAMGKKWHPKCFTCGGCGNELNGPFYDRNGSPFCRSCVESDNKVTTGSVACNKCGRGVSGNYVEWSGKSFHSDCFLCGTCNNKLNMSAFYNVNGKVRISNDSCIELTVLPSQATCERCAN